ncbi:MAG: response regulator [Candidatus Omnitrophica bacterium]|nr:response regulator [Candidatus Omnitrophota bacterium]
MKKIMVVEDSSVQRKIIVKIIQEAGFKNEILEAGDGNIAIDILSEHYSEVGLILCDWNMPNINGLEFIRAAANVPAVKGIPIIMVTTEGTDEKISEAKKAHPNLAGYIPKPFTPQKLREVIDSVIPKN